MLDWQTQLNPTTREQQQPHTSSEASTKLESNMRSSLDD